MASYGGYAFFSGLFGDIHDILTFKLSTPFQIFYFLRQYISYVAI